MKSRKFCAKEIPTIPMKSIMEIICAGFFIFSALLGKYLEQSIPAIIGTPRSISICHSIGRKGMTKVGISPFMLITL